MSLDSLVSVIVPVYNAKDTLERCINSILAQTWDNFEILLIDDGSNDGSAAICKEISDRNAKVIFESQRHRGVSAARNKALQLARGRWMVCVDADDYVEDSYIEDLVNAAISHQSQLAICNYRTERKKKSSIKSLFGGPFTPDIGEAFEEGEIFTMDAEHTCVAALMPDVDQYFSWCKLFDLDIIRKYDLSYNEHYIIWEDYDFFFSYLRFVKRTAFLVKTLYNNTDKGTNLTAIKGKDIEEWRIKSKYYATKNAEANVRSVFDDKTVIESIVSDRVATTAAMFLITKDKDKERKYIHYIRTNLSSFKAFCGLRNGAYNKIRRIADHPFIEKRILRKKRI